MAKKKSFKNPLLPFKIGLVIFLPISLLVISFFVYIFLSFVVFDIESRDFELYDKFKTKVLLVEQYKEKTGTYPTQLSDITSNTICSKKYINFCKTIKYKSATDGSYFAMAAKSLSWPIFYYHSKYPETIKTTNWAKASGKPTAEGYFPVYKQTPPLFENPEEWPEL